MGKLRCCLRAIKSIVEARTFLKLQNGILSFRGCLTNNHFGSDNWNKPRRENYSKGEQIRISFEREGTVLERNLAPLRRSGTTGDVSVLLSSQIQHECIVDAVHVELGPTLVTTFVYESGGSNTPFEGIYFAANEDLSDRVEVQVTPRDPSTHLPLILLPVSLDGHSSCGSSITSTEAGSDRHTWVRRNTYQEDTTFSSSLSAVPSPPSIPFSILLSGSIFEEGTFQHQGNNSSWTIVPECGLAPTSQPESCSLEEIIEDMLLDCIRDLPLSALPLRVPESDVDFLVSLHLSPIKPLVLRRTVATGVILEPSHGCIAGYPTSHQLPEEEPPLYTFYPPVVSSFGEVRAQFHDQVPEVADLVRTAATVLHRELQLASTFGNLEGKSVLDTNTSMLLKDLGRLVASWPDNDMEGVESFRDALSDGTLLLTFVNECLSPSLNVNRSIWESYYVSQEDSILRFIGIYRSVVPSAQQALRESSFEALSVGEIGAYAQAIVSLVDVLGDFVTPQSQQPYIRAPDPEPSGVTPPPTVSSGSVWRLLPALPLPSVDPPFYCEFTPTASTDCPLAPSDISTDLIGPVISQLPEEEGFLYQQLLSIVRNEGRCRLLFQGKGETQNLLDNLHHLLSFPQIDGAARSELLTVLIRLTTTTHLYPKSLMHATDPQIDKEPVTGGGYSEILRGNIQEQGVCVKVVRLYSEVAKKQKNLKAFMREIALWGQLNHPNILPFYGVYHLDNAEEKICLVSPWMENGTLTEYLKSCTDANKLLLVRDVASGLEYLHSRMLVHGDLKGANILITLCGRACLADFGLTSVNNTETARFALLETTGHENATPRYEAPELLGDDFNIHRTTASDMYAFGCVCYETFTGQIPFYEVASSFAAMAKMIRGEIPTRPDSIVSPNLARDITDEIWSFMKSCWSPDPCDRPSASDCLSVNLLKDLNDVRPEEQAIWPPSKYRSATARDTLWRIPEGIQPQHLCH